jgi:hypothetical protein
MTLNLPESSSIAHMSGQVPTEAMHGSRRTVPANPPTEVRTWANILTTQVGLLDMG